MDERRLRVLGVIVPALDAATDGRADHELGRVFPTRAVAVLRQLVDDLIVGRPDEIGELDLHHGHHAVQRHAHCAAHNAVFAERRIDHAVFTELLAEAGGDAEHPAHLADVLTEHHDALVLAHGRTKRLVDGLNHIHLWHRYSSGSGEGDVIRSEKTERAGLVILPRIALASAKAASHTRLRTSFRETAAGSFPLRPRPRGSAGRYRRSRLALCGRPIARVARGTAANAPAGRAPPTA